MGYNPSGWVLPDQLVGYPKMTEVYNSPKVHSLGLNPRIKPYDKAAYPILGRLRILKCSRRVVDPRILLNKVLNWTHSMDPVWTLILRLSPKPEYD